MRSELTTLYRTFQHLYSNYKTDMIHITHSCQSKYSNLVYNICDVGSSLFKLLDAAIGTNYLETYRIQGLLLLLQIVRQK